MDIAPCFSTRAIAHLCHKVRGLEMPLFKLRTLVRSEALSHTLLTLVMSFTKLFKEGSYPFVMDNYVLFAGTENSGDTSLSLGFTHLFCKGKDFEIITASSKKELLLKARQLQQKKMVVFFKPATEEMLRFALEKTTVDGVIGVEEIHPSDSIHYLRGGLDQILCRIAHSGGKKVVFSFSMILNSPRRAQLLARMMFNLELCQKYNVQTIFNNFSLIPEEIRSAADLLAFRRVLEKKFIK